MFELFVVVGLQLRRFMPDGRLVEIPPTHCPAGHRLGRDTVLVGWRPCDCVGLVAKGAAGHRTYLCLAPVAGGACGTEIYRPPCVRAGE